jgi:hypothetical protein
MANTNAIYPGTVTTQSSSWPENSVDWTNPNNIKADDGSYTTAAIAYVMPQSGTYRLKAQNFDFSAIPDGSTIDGILVEIERKASVASRLQDYRVQLLDASGNLVGANKGSSTYYTTSDVVASYGNATDTWSASPTAAMVKDADFGVVLSTKNAVSGTVTASVDFIRITIYYTPPAGRSWGYILGA